MCSLQQSGSRVDQASELDELQQAQLDDPVLRCIMYYKNTEAVCPEDPELQRFALVWNQLEVQGSKLVRVAPRNSDAASQVQVVLPQSLIHEVLKQPHNVPNGGHLGVQKLQGKIKDTFFWSGWLRDVRAWVQDCA